jgi:hypothetical protein
MAWQLVGLAGQVALGHFVSFECFDLPDFKVPSS